jgi:hypothetical protein
VGHEFKYSVNSFLLLTFQKLIIMKKLGLFIFFVVLFSSGKYEQVYSNPEPFGLGISSVPVSLLPNGIYFLCCRNGCLILYNMVGQQVGWGPDCGGLAEGECFRCIIYDDAPCPIPNSELTSEVLLLLNSIKPGRGEPHEGDWCENMQTFYFNASEINW